MSTVVAVEHYIRGVIPRGLKFKSYCALSFKSFFVNAVGSCLNSNFLHLELLITRNSGRCLEYWYGLNC